jgi:hypothetical protein
MTKFSIVKARLTAELDNIETLCKELKKRELFSNTADRKKRLADQFVLRAVGSILHDFYTSAENMFKTIARQIDNSIPEDSEWHIELLKQMAVDIDDIRPHVISIKTRDLLNEFRGFRHVFRNIYGFNLICERIEHLLDILPVLTEKLKQDMDNFIEEMDNVLQ